VKNEGRDVVKSLRTKRTREHAVGGDQIIEVVSERQHNWSSVGKSFSRAYIHTSEDS